MHSNNNEAPARFFLLGIDGQRDVVTSIQRLKLPIGFDRTTDQTGGFLAEKGTFWVAARDDSDVTRYFVQSFNFQPDQSDESIVQVYSRVEKIYIGRDLVFDSQGEPMNLFNSRQPPERPLLRGLQRRARNIPRDIVTLTPSVIVAPSESALQNESDRWLVVIDQNKLIVHSKENQGSGQSSRPSREINQNTPAILKAAISKNDILVWLQRKAGRPDTCELYSLDLNQPDSIPQAVSSLEASELEAGRAQLTLDSEGKWVALSSIQVPYRSEPGAFEINLYSIHPESRTLQIKSIKRENPRIVSFKTKFVPPDQQHPEGYLVSFLFRGHSSFAQVGVLDLSELNDPSDKEMPLLDVSLESILPRDSHRFPFIVLAKKDIPGASNRAQGWVLRISNPSRTENVIDLDFERSVAAGFEILYDPRDPSEEALRRSYAGNFSGFSGYGGVLVDRIQGFNVVSHGFIPRLVVSPR